jgi:Tfp pilus assembly protein PilF
MNNEEEKGVMYNYSMMGSLYGYVGNFEKSEYYYKKALNSANEVENLEYHWYIPLILYNLMSISKKLGNKNDETHYQGQLKNIRKNTSDIRSFDTLLSDAVNFERVFFNLPPIAINLDFLNE